MYLIKFTDEGRSDAGHLPRSVRNALEKVLLDRLTRDPRGCSTELREPLKGWRSFHWRKYRVVFMIFENLKTIAVAGVSECLPQSQRDIYRRLQDLAAEGRLAEEILVALRGFTSSR